MGKKFRFQQKCKTTNQGCRMTQQEMEARIEKLEKQMRLLFVGEWLKGNSLSTTPGYWIVRNKWYDEMKKEINDSIKDFLP